MSNESPADLTSTETSSAAQPRYNTRTIMTAAAIGAAVGVVLIPLNFLMMGITTTLPILAVVFYGFWGMSSLIPLALIQRAGTGVIGGVAAGLVSSFSPYGITMVVMMLFWGIFMELSFTVTRYRHFGWKMFAVVGVVTGLLSCVMSYYSLNLGAVETGLTITLFVVQILSFIVFSLLSLVVARALRRAGVAGGKRGAPLS